MRRSPMTGLVLALAALMAIPAAAAATPQPFTLEQVLSAPFPDNFVASPSGSALAWTFNASGARNVWVAQPPEYKGRAVTAYAADDGQELGELAFTPDGKAVVYVRGGDANRKGEHPNPLHRPEGVEQAIWIVALDGTAPRKLAEGHSPAVSPRGDRVAFVRKGQVWWAPLSADGKAEQAIEARGEAASLHWSPDGSRLAFVSERGDHSFVGVYDVAGKAVRYLDPSVDRDQEPAWSPDGNRVAFLRLPASKELQFFRAHRQGLPWSIRVADAATGAGSLVFRAEAGRGSVFREIVAPNQIFWADGGRIVFPWEKDGWTHLYSVPISGGAATLLTPGAFEVEYVSLSADRRTVLYNSNQDDIERRHLWSVPAAGGKPVALTTGSGLEWLPDSGFRRKGDCLRPVRRETPGEPGDPDRVGAGQRPRSRRNPGGLSRGGPRHTRDDRLLRLGRHEDPRPALPAAEPQGRRAAAGAALLSRRLAAPDAAGLPLHGLLPQRLRVQSVPRQPRLHRPVG